MTPGYLGLHIGRLHLMINMPKIASESWSTCQVFGRFHIDSSGEGRGRRLWPTGWLLWGSSAQPTWSGADMVNTPLSGTPSLPPTKRRKLGTRRSSATCSARMATGGSIVSHTWVVKTVRRNPRSHGIHEPRPWKAKMGSRVSLQKIKIGN